MRRSSQLGIFLLFLLTRAQTPIECQPRYNVTLVASEGNNVVTSVRRETSIVDNGNLTINILVRYILLPQ